MFCQKLLRPTQLLSELSWEPPKSWINATQRNVKNSGNKNSASNVVK